MYQNKRTGQVTISISIGNLKFNCIYISLNFPLFLSNFFVLTYGASKDD